MRIQCMWMDVVGLQNFSLRDILTMCVGMQEKIKKTPGLTDVMDEECMEHLLSQS